jgi:hypothetical protein
MFAGLLIIQILFQKNDNELNAVGMQAAGERFRSKETRFLIGGNMATV